MVCSLAVSFYLSFLFLLAGIGENLPFTLSLRSGLILESSLESCLGNYLLLRSTFTRTYLYKL